MTYMPEPPDRDRASADQERMMALLRAVEAPAPAALRQRIAELAAPRPVRRRRRRRPALALAGGFAIGIALLLAFGGGTEPPTVVRISTVALERATGPAPRTLVAAGTTIVFPHWSSRGWPSRGVRSDRVGGHSVTTEFFSSYPDGTVGYAIVAGAPLPWGTSGQIVTRGGRRYLLTSYGGAKIVTWVQDGHTCVLASRTAPASMLLALAVA
jgi:hypothetical protein